MHRCEIDEKGNAKQDDAGRAVWTGKRKTSGWIVPIAVGFHGLTEPGRVRSQRDQDTPHRFADKRKVWSYCGLGVVGRQSDQMIGPKHLTRTGNRSLKDLAKGAAISAIRTEQNQYARQYRRLLAKGTAPQNARLTVARAIVSTLYAMWRDGTAYQART